MTFIYINFKIKNIFEYNLFNKSFFYNSNMILLTKNLSSLNITKLRKNLKKKKNKKSKPKNLFSYSVKFFLLLLRIPSIYIIISFIIPTSIFISSIIKFLYILFYTRSGFINKFTSFTI